MGTFHRLLLFLYWPNNIFYPITLNLRLTENVFALLHFQINIFYYFLYFFPLMGTSGQPPQDKNVRFYYLCGDIWSPQCSKHTHTFVLWIVGTFHRRNGFYIVQTAFILPYTNPTSKPTLTKNSFSHWTQKKTMISDIAIFVGTFCPHKIGFTLITHTHTHTCTYKIVVIIF